MATKSSAQRPRAASTSARSTARSTRASTSTSSPAAAGARPTRSRPTRRAGAASTSWPSATARSCTRSSRRRRTPRPDARRSRPRSATTTPRAWTRPASRRRARSRSQPMLARDRGAIVEDGAASGSSAQHEAAALPTLFRFGAAPDLHDSKQTIASLGQGGLGLPDRDDYLKDDAKSKEKREKYVEHVARMLELRRRDAGGGGEGDAADGAADRDRAGEGAPRPRRDARPEEPRQPDDRRRAASGSRRPSTGTPTSAATGRAGLHAAEPHEPAVLREGERGRGGHAARRLEDVPALARGARRRAHPGRGLRRGGLPLQPRVPAAARREIEPRWKRCVAGDRPRARRRARAALRREDLRRRRQGAHEEDDRGAHGRAARGHREPALDDGRDQARRRSRSSRPSARDKVGYPDKWKDYSIGRGQARRLLRQLAARAGLRDRAQLRAHRQADGPHALGHDAADRERLLQRGQQRDRVPGRHPAAAVLRPAASTTP